MMPAIVFTLCFLTSLACGVMLLRGYRKSRARLLLWSSVCFFGFALNNAFLILDLQVMPNVDLSTFRSIPVMIGLAALLYGLIWESA